MNATQRKYASTLLTISFVLARIATASNDYRISVYGKHQNMVDAYTKLRNAALVAHLYSITSTLSRDHVDYRSPIKITVL